jgi:glycogen operon protein
VRDESFLMLFNAHHDPLTFRMPTRRFGQRWELELSTADPEADGDEAPSWAAREELEVESRSIVLLRKVA